MPKQSSKKGSKSESEEQADVVRSLRKAGVGFFAVPNELGRGRRGVPGFAKGAPDLVIVDLALCNDRPTALEMKKAGGRVSAEQEMLHAEMRREGWNVIVAWSASEAICRLKQLGYRVKNEGLE